MDHSNSRCSKAVFLGLLAVAWSGCTGKAPTADEAGIAIDRMGATAEIDDHTDQTEKTEPKALEVPPVSDTWSVTALLADGSVTLSGLNGAGIAVGTTRLPSGGSLALRWIDGQAQVLSGEPSSALGINDAGDIAGTIADEPVVWEQEAIRRLPALPGWATIAFHARGKYVVGNAAQGEVAMRAVLWTDGLLRELRSLGGPGSQVYALNAEGVAVGMADVDDKGTTHAALWKGDEVVDLGTFGGTVSKAYGINDAGLVVGGAYHEDGHHTAFTWKDGQLTDLGTLPGHTQSWAFACNSRGDVVGWSSDDQEQRAVLWSGGRANILDEHLLMREGDLSISLTTVNCLNEQGDIAGMALLQGQHFPVVLRRLTGAPETAKPSPTDPEISAMIKRLAEGSDSESKESEEALVVRGPDVLPALLTASTEFTQGKLTVREPLCRVSVRICGTLAEGKSESQPNAAAVEIVLGALKSPIPGAQAGACVTWARLGPRDAEEFAPIRALVRNPLNEHVAQAALSALQFTLERDVNLFPTLLNNFGNIAVRNPSLAPLIRPMQERSLMAAASRIHATGYNDDRLAMIAEFLTNNIRDLAVIVGDNPEFSGGFQEQIFLCQTLLRHIQSLLP